MEHFEFIDHNSAGLKERLLGATIQLYNKLSADETNNIRTKLNELVDAVNATGVPLYEVFALKFKGSGNTDMASIEVGDIAKRYSTVDGIWENAMYNGGDPQDQASYTLLDLPKPEPVLYTAVATGTNQTFACAFEPGSVLKSKGELFKTTEWTYDGADVTIIVNVNTGNTIYLKP